jgi:KDO2-lipid IV(A) lauroyltransferase
VQRLIAMLPWSWVHALGRVTAFFVGSVLRYRRGVVTQNLQNSFPNKSNAEITNLRKEFYLNIADLALETFKSLGMTATELRARVKITNPELLAPYNAQQHPVIVLGSHQANWEWVFLACSAILDIPVDGVYRPLHNKRIDRIMSNVRTRFGARLIADNDAFKDIVAHLQTLRVVSLIADQRPRKKGSRYWTNFLEQDSAFVTGWAVIAQTTKSPVFFAHRERTARGHYRITLEKIGEPPYSGTPDSLVEEYARALERSILQQPGNWLWSHKRWRDERPLYE